MDWSKILRTTAPRGNRLVIDGFAKSMGDVVSIADLTTPLRLAHFLGEVAQETDGFAVVEEYASGRAYEGRSDLGNSHPGDGVRFKGRGGLMTTGRNNYTYISRAFGWGDQLLLQPQLLGQFPYAVLAAAYEWRKRGLNVYADCDDVLAVAKRINGVNRKTGKPNGLAARIAYTKAAKRALGSYDPSDASTDLSIKDLAKAGSRTITGAGDTQKAAIGLGGLSGLQWVLDQVQGVADQASTVVAQAQGAKSAAGALVASASFSSWLGAHWLSFAKFVLLLAAVGLVIYAWRAAHRVKLARVEDAREAISAIPRPHYDDDDENGAAGDDENPLRHLAD